jgi:nucleotide-binding universal stress UspA family protein
MIRVTQILCPVDFSTLSQHALDHAAALATWYEAGLTLLYVFVNLPTMDVPPLVLEERDRERLLAGLKKMARAVPPRIPLEFRVQQAEYVHDEIVAQLEATRADLLVLGTHGRSGFQRLFLGSVTEKVIRKTTCPTLVVPPRAADAAPDAPVQLRRILCPVDFSASSLAALAYAVDIAEEADARLTVMHVIEIPPELRENALAADFDVDHIRAAAEAEARRRLDDLIPGDARTYCTVRTDVVEGGAYQQVLRQAAAERPDLIVMGVHGRSAVDMLVFGSTTHHVIRAAYCPVLIIRSK